MLRTSIACMLLLGCSKGPTTAPGTLGEVDLAPRLPAGVTVPAQITAHDATLAVCPGGKGDTPASVRVRWKAFAKDGASYISSYAVDLEKSVSGVTLKLEGEPKIQNANASRGGPPMAVVAITLKCTRKESEKLIFEEPSTIYVRADGSSNARAQ